MGRLYKPIPPPNSDIPPSFVFLSRPFVAPFMVPLRSIRGIREIRGYFFRLGIALSRNFCYTIARCGYIREGCSLDPRDRHLR